MIESAIFDGVSIRNTSRKLALPSEASIRYGKGLSYEYTEMASMRACHLLEKYADATVLSGTVIKLKFDCVNGNNETEDREANLFVRYQAPANGKTFVVNGVTYSVTGKDTVSVKSVKKKATKVTIPATVYSIYKVTGIAAKAMSGCNKLKTITVKSSNIKSVGSNAFKGVKKSCKASVPKAKKAAYKKLFKKGGYKGKVK